MRASIIPVLSRLLLKQNVEVFSDEWLSLIELRGRIVIG